MSYSGRGIVFLTWIYRLHSDRAVRADGETESIFSSSDAHLQDSQNTPEVSLKLHLLSEA